MTYRKTKPAELSEIKFHLPQSTEFILSNGLKVFFIKKDKLPMVRLLHIVNTGSKFDPEDKFGLAHLTSLVMEEGADDLTALQLSDEFDLLGTTFSISTDNDFIAFNLQCLTEHFERSLELFSKVLLKPSFNEDDFLREKKKLLTKILQRKDEPDYIADEIFEKIVLGKSNYYSHPITGYERTVESVSVKDIISFYKDYFSSSNSNLIIVGNIDQAELEQLLNQYLSNWKSDHQKIELTASSIESKKKIYLYHKEDTVQTEIRVGHISEKRNQKDYFQRHLLNTILGGQFTSRINLNLRERNGYTYGANSRFQYFKDSAYFAVSTSVGIDNTANALKEILFELENIHNEIIDAELEFTKSSLIKRFPLNFETYHQLAIRIFSKIMFDLPEDYYESYINNINAVSKSEVEEAAKKFINNDKCAIVLVGDKNILLKKLKKLKIEIAEVNLFGEEI